MAEKKKMSKVKKVILIVCGSIVCVAAAVYCGIGYYFKSHFYPRTTINGVSVALADDLDAESLIREEAEDFLLAVHDRDDRVSYMSGTDIDYRYKPDGSVALLLKAQEPFLWPAHVFKEHNETVEVPMVYNEEKITQWIRKMPCFEKENIVQPEDARLEKTDKGYELIPEVMGSQPLEEQIFLDVKKAVDDRSDVLKLTDDDYVKPKVMSDDEQLVKKLAVVEQYQNMSVTYKIEGFDQVLTGDTILSWITIKDDLSIEVDDQMLAVYAQQLASTYNTYADVRNFKTSSGDTINIGGGDYGWIIAKQREAEELKKDILAGEPVTREPCYEQRAFVEGKDDIGNTYIEIDYTKQHMWYYKDGKKVLDSDIVSGNIKNGNGSPDGVFKVISKLSPAVLSGEDYESKVTYFMPFAYNVGLHDADWRSSFGGSIYNGNGSHGCINLPYSTAKALFENVQTGTPVIAYYRESIKLTSNNAKMSNAYSYSSK